MLTKIIKSKTYMEDILMFTWKTYNSNAKYLHMVTASARFS